MIGAMQPILKKDIRNEDIPFIKGGDGRYLWVVCTRAQTLNVWDLNGYARTSIALTAGKDFSAGFYDPVDQVVRCVGNAWCDSVDINPASGTFLTVVKSEAWITGSASYIIGSYIPWPIDIWSSGGSSAPLNNRRPTIKFVSNDGRYTGTIRIGGHSNSINIVYYHHSHVISVNKLSYKVKRLSRHGNKSMNYQDSDFLLQLDPYGLPYQDLQALNYPVTKFGNFYIVFTDANAYLMSSEGPHSHILNTLSTLGVGANRTMSLWCPNARKMIACPGITSNIFSVISIDKVNRVLVDDGDVNRLAYKAANEAGCQGLIYSPYNGNFYLCASNNVANTGIDKIHEYNPNNVVGSMYVQSLTSDELNSANRTSISALNIMGLNMCPVWEYPDEFI